MRRATGLLVGEQLVPTRVMVLEEPLSLWGGLDPSTGHIVDRNHPQYGRCVTDMAVHMSASRGSSSSSSVLAEAVRAGTGPRALLLASRDQILLVGAIVAWELYGRGPVISLLPEGSELHDGACISIAPNGDLTVHQDDERMGLR